MTKKKEVFTAQFRG